MTSGKRAARTRASPVLLKTPPFRSVSPETSTRNVVEDKSNQVQVNNDKLIDSSIGNSQPLAPAFATRTRPSSKRGVAQKPQATAPSAAVTRRRQQQPKQQPDTSSSSRPKRQRKPVELFDARPWSLEERTELYQQKGISKKGERRASRKRLANGYKEEPTTRKRARRQVAAVARRKIAQEYARADEDEDEVEREDEDASVAELPLDQEIHSDDDEPHWDSLDYMGLISDYKYGDFAPVSFGNTFESAVQTVDSQLEAMETTSDKESDPHVIESKMYHRSLKERQQKAEGERIEKERHKEEVDKRILELQYQYRHRKKSAQEVELERFVDQPLHFTDVLRTASRALKCSNGPDCQFCIKPEEPTRVKDSDIFAPFFRPISIKDAWQETSTEVEGDVSLTTRRRIKVPARRARNSNKTQHSIDMLSEMKHSLQFVHDYNQGYIHQG